MERDKNINNLIFSHGDENTVASIAAYFLAKYNERAIAFLGYKNNSDAFNSIAEVLEAKPNYIKLRRDEFDVLIPESPRQGWHKRDIRAGVKNYHNELKDLSFEELSLKVKKLIELYKWNSLSFEAPLKTEISGFKEKDIEDIINFKDDTAKIRIVSRALKERLLNYNLINDLKSFYNYRCQVCGKSHFDTYSVHVSEAHHIDPFVINQNNNAANLMILCPDHHRIIHAATPTFDRTQKSFQYPNGYSEFLTINDHL